MKLSRSTGTILFLVFSLTSLNAQTPSQSPCTWGHASRAAGGDLLSLGHGIMSVPRNAIRPHNLDWELPVAASTGLLIAKGDRPGADRIQSRSLQSTSRTWSNVGMGMELGIGGLGWAAGCMSKHSHLTDAAFTSLVAAGSATALHLTLKAAFARQYPYTSGSTGKFWSNGHSMPSGHSATSFAFAATMAHRYPHNEWIKWGSYALATGVSVARFTAKRHYASDILVGGALGYVSGAYIADHAR
ncbi:MAG TPA: phosphatase PAP2 family protein [candidate division Zixibacteria bacterium]|nr:phosphatase PAP2 family protein [candidate division Zixibacteria bacterium]